MQLIYTPVPQNVDRRVNRMIIFQIRVHLWRGPCSLRPALAANYRLQTFEAIGLTIGGGGARGHGPLFRNPGYAAGADYRNPRDIKRYSCSMQ